MTAAQRAIIRLLSSDRISGGNRDKVKLAAEAIRTFEDTEFKQAILGNYDGRMHWETVQQVSETFPSLLSDPAIAEHVQEILDRI